MRDAQKSGRRSAADHAGRGGSCCGEPKPCAENRAAQGRGESAEEGWRPLRLLSINHEPIERATYYRTSKHWHSGWCARVGGRNAHPRAKRRATTGQADVIFERNDDRAATDSVDPRSSAKPD